MRFSIQRGDGGNSPLDRNIAIGEHLAARDRHQLLIVRSAFFEGHVLKYIVNEEQHGHDLAGQVEAVIPGLGEVVAREPAETATHELLPRFLAGEGPMLEEELVRLVYHLICERVGEGGQTGRGDLALGEALIEWHCLDRGDVDGRCLGGLSGQNGFFNFGRHGGDGLQCWYSSDGLQMMGSWFF